MMLRKAMVGLYALVAYLAAAPLLAALIAAQPIASLPDAHVLDAGLGFVIALGAAAASALVGQGLLFPRAPWQLERQKAGWETSAHYVVNGALVLALAVGVLALSFALASRVESYFPPSTIVRVAQYDAPANRPAVIAMALPIVIFVLLAAPVVFQPRKLHGNARWGSIRDAMKAHLLAPAGVVLGRWGGRVVRYGGAGHVLGMAPSRSGKGVGWIVPTLLEWPGSVIVSDPKAENYTLTGGWREKQGHQVLRFDAFGGAGVRWNPLQYIVDAAADPEDEIDRVARLMYPSPQTGEKHWADSARGLFRGVVAHLWFREREALTLARVLDWSTTVLPHPADVATLLADTHPLAQRELTKYVATADKERSSILSTFLTALSPWQIPSVRDATSGSEIDFRSLRSSRQAIYFTLAPGDGARAGELQRLWWQQIIDTMTRRLPGPREPWPVLVLLDEFTLPGPMPLIMESAAFLAGYGVKLFLVVQSRHQLDATYDPARTRALIDTMAVRVVYAPNEQGTAEAISRELGTTTVQQRSRSRDMMGSGRTTVSTSQASRALLMPQEVMQLPEDACIVMSERSRPLRIRKARFYKDRPWRERASMPIQSSTSTVQPSRPAAPAAPPVNLAQIRRHAIERQLALIAPQQFWSNELRTLFHDRA